MLFRYLLPVKENFKMADKSKTVCLRTLEDNSSFQKLPLLLHYVIDEYRL